MYLKLANCFACLPVRKICSVYYAYDCFILSWAISVCIYYRKVYYNVYKNTIITAVSKASDLGFNRQPDDKILRGGQNWRVCQQQMQCYSIH